MFLINSHQEQQKSDASYLKRSHKLKFKYFNTDVDRQLPTWRRQTRLSGSLLLVRTSWRHVRDGVIARSICVQDYTSTQVYIRSQTEVDSENARCNFGWKWDETRPPNH